MTLAEEARDLFNTKFLVIDVETTGTSPITDEITEIAAILVRGGKIIDSFETLLSIEGSISSEISVMTGIYPSMLKSAPKFVDVASRLVDMAEGAVVVGHNIRFDLSFIDCALGKIYSGYHLADATLDTVTLSRKLLRGQVSNFKLGTLAASLKLDNQPCHRAMADVRATVDLLHYLIDLSSSYGSHDLGSLLDIPSNTTPQAKSKLKISNYLPRLPGIYMMADLTGEIYYVGKASDLNSRFRSYFSSDTRRKVDPMLRRLSRLTYVVTQFDEVAEVLEARLISKYQPRQNSIGKKDPRNFRYVELSNKSKASKVVRFTDGIIDERFFGPFRSSKSASDAARCIDMCYTNDFSDHSHEGDPTSITLKELTTRVERRLEDLVRQQRFEEACLLRDGATMIAHASVRRAAIDLLRQTESLLLSHRDSGEIFEVRRGLLEISTLSGGEISIHPTFNTVSTYKLDPNQISEITSPKVSGLKSIEEEWTLWRRLVSNPNFEVLEATQEVSLPISLSHRNLKPRDRSVTESPLVERAS
ncbi:MAG: exonuclease domain-containing protein [Actinomycetota bacterium]|nr:exonuclease domain-containing protein [Actinomycetota bacterium]